MAQKPHFPRVTSLIDQYRRSFGDVSELVDQLDTLSGEAQPSPEARTLAQTPSSSPQEMKDTFVDPPRLPTIVCTNADGSSFVVWSSGTNSSSSSGSNSNSTLASLCDLRNREAVDALFVPLPETDMDDGPSAAKELVRRERAQGHISAKLRFSTQKLELRFQALLRWVNCGKKPKGTEQECHRWRRGKKKGKLG